MQISKKTEWSRTELVITVRETSTILRRNCNEVLNNYHSQVNLQHPQQNLKTVTTSVVHSFPSTNYDFTDFRA